jgi:GTP-binding protein
MTILAALKRPLIQGLPRYSKNVTRNSNSVLKDSGKYILSLQPLPQQQQRPPLLVFRFFSSSPQVTTDDSINKPQTSRRLGIRDVAVIAHVDHGKTSLVDQLLHASEATAANGASSSSNTNTRLLDSGDLEKERGITITSKVTRLEYHHPSTEQQETNTTIINVVDTPGHADFCGEVDRILSMVDGVLLVVDIVEGPKSQTKYVLNRALALGLKPLVVLNKCDKPEALAALDSGDTEQLLHTLFQALGASDDQLDYVTAYASARNGWVTMDPLEALELAEEGYSAFDANPNATSSEADSSTSLTSPHNMTNLLQAILEEIPEPLVTTYTEQASNNLAQDGEAFRADPFSMGAVTVGYDPYLGRTCTGRIASGCISINDSVTLLKRDGSGSGPTGIVSGIFFSKGIRRTPLNETTAFAGDIIQVSGIPDSIAVGDTLTSTHNPVPEPIQTPPLAPPTLAMDFGSNNGPLAGQEGTKIASSQIRQRLLQETDNNVTLLVKPSETDVEKTTVFARGELQLGILIETMRREGFEMIISPPRILTKICPDTKKTLEPFEEVTIDVDVAYSSTVVSALTGDRKGILMASEVMSDGKARLVLEVPTRGLLGFNNEIASATKGSAVVNHLFLEDREYAGNLGTALEKGKLVSNASGKATAFALDNLSQRGTLFVEPQEMVYPGMVIGENSKIGDLEVNPVKAKELTNMR